MIVCIGVFFYLGAALYIAAGVMAVLYLRPDNDRALDRAIRLAAAGAACLAATFLFRWLVWRLVPMTTVSDSINLLVLLSTLVMLFLMQKRNVRALACFYLPPLAALCAVSAAVAHRYLFAAPREFPGLPLAIHVGLAFLAYAMFFLAGMTSAAYIFQSQRLKRRNPTGIFQQLPSLEQLHHTLSRLVSLGYPLFVVTLLLGGIWAHTERDLLGARWWLAPKIVMAFVMAAFCAVTHHSRRSGRLRGPKLAYLVFLGFILLLAAYLVLALMHLRTYNFWGAAA
jgi:ABC-type transport system involved in cytochrome c biogenesis permease subunit